MWTHAASCCLANVLVELHSFGGRIASVVIEVDADCRVSYLFATDAGIDRLVEYLGLAEACVGLPKVVYGIVEALYHRLYGPTIGWVGPIVGNDYFEVHVVLNRVAPEDFF